MKTSRKWNLKAMAGKIMVGLVLITLIGGITAAPALADRGNKSYNKHDNGRHRGHYKQARPVYRHYDYYGRRERVYYPPPPVVYAPPPPPGIGIFFPPIFIHP